MGVHTVGALKEQGRISIHTWARGARPTGDTSNLVTYVVVRPTVGTGRKTIGESNARKIET